MPARLRPTAPISADAILVGDPGRALMLAQELLEQPKMSNHARGLWGYSGRTPAGQALTIQSTGMGGPSAVVVLTDLAELGVRRAIRVGTCAGLRKGVAPGELVIVAAALSTPGPDAEVPPALPDGRLMRALEQELRDAARSGSVISLPTLHRPGVDAPPAAGDVADMQTAALLSHGGQLGMLLAAVLVVEQAADEELPEEELEAAAKHAAGAAIRAFST
jgi:purine-nucleoside phosphorylase